MNLPTPVTLAAAVLALAGAAQAQTTTPSGSADERHSMLPYTTRGYLGINLGQADFDTPCGAGGYGCEKSRMSAYLYTGGLLNDWLGVELGYLNTGRADRAGGRSKAEGLGAALMLRAPLGPASVFAKAGGMYTQTTVTAGTGADVPTGKRRSWAPTWGAGVGYDLTPHHGVVVEWSRARVRFAGSDERRDVDNTSVGYVYRF